MEKLRDSFEWEVYGKVNSVNGGTHCASLEKD